MYPAKKNQQGAVLLLVLIMLGVFLVGGAAVLKVMSATSTASGAAARHDMALAVASEAVLAARKDLAGLKASLNNTVANTYYSTTTTAPADDPHLRLASGSPKVTASGFEARYIIERMCLANPGAPANPVECLRVDASLCSGASDGGGESEVTRQFSESSPICPVLFRVTVQVREAGRNYGSYKEQEVIVQAGITMSLT